MINKRELQLLQDALGILEQENEALRPFTPGFDEDRAAAVLGEVARRMQDNFPYYHPQYAGQMLKPPHPVARMAYALSLYVNPNNHAPRWKRSALSSSAACLAGKRRSGT